MTMDGTFGLLCCTQRFANVKKISIAGRDESCLCFGRVRPENENRKVDVAPRESTRCLALFMRKKAIP